MKNNIKLNTKSALVHVLRSATTKSILSFILILTFVQVMSFSQENMYKKPTWWFGAAGAANLNYFRGSTQLLNAAFTPPVAFHNGKGTGWYAAPLIEYHHPSSGLGLMFQVGYDSRKGAFDQVISPCNCPADLSVNLSYLSIEPSIRFAPGNSNFYLYGGPRLAINMDKSFTYKLGINPAYPNQELTPDVKGDLSNINTSLISMQLGAGYDISLNSQKHRIQAILSPFISIQPYFGQSPRSVETWNLTTVRAGAALKFGRGSLISNPEELQNLSDGITFTINSPANIPTQRTVVETFPLRNYIFFDLGSTEIPDRYILIKKSQAKDFTESQPNIFKPKNFSGRSDREMNVYYNVLNILGDRLSKNPTAQITLVGSSEKGPQDGKKMALSIKTYLSEVFSIDTARIATEGRDKPKIPSEQPGGTLELDLLREGDRRVSVESSSPSLLMEFENGNITSMKPVQFKVVQAAPLDSYVTFNVDGAKKQFTSWSLIADNKKGKVQRFGPYTTEKVSIPGKLILGTQKEGDYNITMQGIKKDGSVIVKNATTHIVLWTPLNTTEGTRFSILYEFNDAKVTSLYEKYLKEVVVQKISSGSRVIIHGYTDNIGDEVNNSNLSLARANRVHEIIQSSLTKSGLKDVTFDVYGFGEDSALTPFENKYPEERFYNRTVIIDIIPPK